MEDLWHERTSLGLTSALFEVCFLMTMHEKENTWPEKPVQRVYHFNLVRGVFLCDNARKGQYLTSKASSECLPLQLSSRCVPPWEGQHFVPEKPVQIVCHLIFVRGVFLRDNVWKGQHLAWETRSECLLPQLCSRWVPSWKGQHFAWRASSEHLLLQLCSRCVPPWQCMKMTSLGLRSQFRVSAISTLFEVCSSMRRTALCLKSQFRLSVT